MSNIMVPKFYNDLWEIAEQLIDKTIKGTRETCMVITKTPSTSKSIMGWYFIYKLRMELGFFNLVYQHEVTRRQTSYSKDGIVTWATIIPKSFSDILSSSDLVYIVDGGGA